MYALQASMAHAAEVAAGMPFVLKLTLQSYSALLQTMEVALKDSAGFVTSGQSHASLYIVASLAHCFYSRTAHQPFTHHHVHAHDPIHCESILGVLGACATLWRGVSEICCIVKSTCVA